MNEEIIAMLRKDMMGEHQAIIQYLAHAYPLGEGELAAEIEAIAREEMRHLDWLADAIVELGGDPTMDRDPVDLSPAPVEQQMLKDVGLEQQAIDQYRAHLEKIQDPKIRRLIARIVHDEMVHKGQFASFAEEAAAAPAEPSAGGEPAAMPAKSLADILNQGIRHEYTVTLQYLYHSFVAEGKELAEELQNVAINEMQHMGWLAEALAGRGGKPDMSHTELALSRDPEDNLKADIAAEREVTRDYSDQIPAVEDPSVRALIERIRDHEIHHDAVFNDLLEEVEDEEAAPASSQEPETPAAKPVPKPPSVGSLIDKA